MRARADFSAGVLAWSTLKAFLTTDSASRWRAASGKERRAGLDGTGAGLGVGAGVLISEEAGAAPASARSRSVVHDARPHFPTRSRIALSSASAPRLRASTA